MGKKVKTIAEMIGEYKYGSWQQMPLQNQIVAENLAKKIDALYSDPPSPEMVCPKAETCDCPCQGKHPHKKNVGCTNKPTEGCPDCVPVPSPEHPEKVRETLALERWIELTGEIQGDWTWEQAKTNAPMSTKSVQQERDWWILKLQQAGWGNLKEAQAEYLAKFTAYRDEEGKLMSMVKAEARQQALKELKDYVCNECSTPNFVNVVIPKRIWDDWQK